MELQNALFWIWLAEALGAGNRDVKRLLQVYDGPYAVYHAEDGEIAQVEGISDSTKAKLQSKSLERASQILDLCERQSIGILQAGKLHLRKCCFQNPYSRVRQTIRCFRN